MLSVVRHRAWVNRVKTVVLGVIAAAALTSASPASAAPILSAVPSTQTVSEGDEFLVDFVISGIEDLLSYEFSVTFDTELFDALFVTAGTFLTDPLFSPFISEEAGTILFFLGDPIASASGTGTLFTVMFEAQHVDTDRTGEFSFFFDTVTSLDGLYDDRYLFGNSIPVDIAGGSVTVAAPPTSVPEPSTMLLLSTGLAASVVASRRRKRGGPPPRL